MASCGSGGVNAGDIYTTDDADTHTAGVPDTQTLIQSKIATGEGQSQLARFTVPAGFTAYITHIYLVASAKKTVTYKFFRRSTIVNVDRILLNGDLTDDTFVKPYAPYLPILEKETIFVRAKVDTGVGSVSAGFDLLCVPNG